MERKELLKYIIINLKSIYIKDNNNYKGDSVNKIENNNYQYFNRRFNNLIRFIENNHKYYRIKESSLMLYFRIVNPNKEYNTIIVPIDFKTIIDSLKLGLEYIIKLNSIGFCPFLKSNLCILNSTC
ncbi:MAG: hypothetical protein JXA99_15480 [Candidatus Lokiarchaeota archaeon]|nr:hypothetical protein [Candidatus Lokiarchaeota archaeon]